MENLDLIIFNSILLLLTLWFALYVNRNFIYKTRINKQRFKLFALRDELTILAMKGEIDYHSKEYQFLLKSLNSLIKITGNFQISDFLKYLISNYDNKKPQEKVKKIKKSIETHSDGLNKIWIEYYKVMNAIMERHLRLFMRIFLMLIISIAGILVSIKLCTKFANWALDTGQKIQSSAKTIKELSEMKAAA